VGRAIPRDPDYILAARGPIPGMPKPDGLLSYHLERTLSSWNLAGVSGVQFPETVAVQVVSPDHLQSRNHDDLDSYPGYLRSFSMTSKPNSL
jgi:hypothetical protein